MSRKNDPDLIFEKRNKINVPFTLTLTKLYINHRHFLSNNATFTYFLKSYDDGIRIGGSDLKQPVGRISDNFREQNLHRKRTMAILLSRTNVKRSPRKKNRGTKFRPKTSIVALLTGGFLVYLLSFLNVALRIHLLDQTENDLVNEADANDRARRFFENKDSHGKDNGIHFERETNEKDEGDDEKTSTNDQILTAYIENTDRSAWDTRPLPVRNVKAEDLVKTEFPKLGSCSKLPEQWPVDDYPDADPFLPWIHDVFPTEDGKFIQFVAQNRRRCHTGKTEEEQEILDHNEPQVALFQHVPLKKLESKTEEEEPRYRLASHEDADLESIDTRFICRFKPSGDITFSEFNNDYEWAATQKRQDVMFSEDGRDNWQIQTSQLIFRCPVPDHLVELVRTGDSVQNDWATIFVDLIPVRTPPRYGIPDEFLVPRYATSKETPVHKRFNPHDEWGKEHILPKLDDSGRWENIPVCKPSLMTYEPQALIGPKSNEKKKHHLVSCLWASTEYSTRGNRYAINDAQRRLSEWITFNKILGFDHFYIYDNSGAHTDQSSLQPIADLFPEDVTLLNWPSKVCNNNPNFHDSVGERSSQYAAETSCRLRFGAHSNWIGQFDIDEYLIPMGNLTSILPLLEKLDEEGNKIINFASWRAWPRRTHIA